MVSGDISSCNREPESVSIIPEIDLLQFDGMCAQHASKPFTISQPIALHPPSIAILSSLGSRCSAEYGSAFHIRSLDDRDAAI
jgi:hypothetical protein